MKSLGNRTLSKSALRKESRQEKQFINHILYCIKAPIVVFPGYEDTVTPDISNKVHLERLIRINDIENNMATDYEIALYLNTASFIAPLPHQFYKIYLHVFLKYFPIEKLASNDNEKSWILRDAELFEDDLYQLKKLKAWLFKRQSERMKN